MRAMNGGSPRVALAGFLHESNTFLPVLSHVNDFRTTSWNEGADILTRWSGALHEVGGLIDGCAAEGLSIEPLLVTYAVPSGTIVAEAFEEIASRITDSLRAAMPVDGVLLALHGATVSEQHRDADGEIIRRVRAIAGAEVPIIVTLDLHANISRLMVDESNAIVCYRTNPHLDQRERGLEAASLMARTVRGEVWPVQAMETPPWIIPIDRQYTSQLPAKQLYDDIGEVMKNPRILSASVAMGFYFADVREMGASFLAVADGDPALARSAAAGMAERAWARRHQFRSGLVPVEEAVRRAASSDKCPVGLFDVGDNVGGGSPADSTILLEEIIRQGVPNCLAVLYDPESVSACVAAGVRNAVRLSVGAKTDTMHGLPVILEGVVRTLADGRFVERERRHGGWGQNDQGLTAVVETANATTVVLTSRRMAPMSLQQLLSVGVTPQEKRAIVVKGVIAPRAAYEPVCPEILTVDTPGVTTGDSARFTYRNRRKQMYPLEEDAVYATSVLHDVKGSGG